MPLMSTDTPASCEGSGTLRAAAAVGASCDPKTLRTPPGASFVAKDAPCEAAVMVVAAEESAGITVTATLALAVSKAASPLYSAVIVLVPVSYTHLTLPTSDLV